MDCFEVGKNGEYNDPLPLDLLTLAKIVPIPYLTDIKRGFELTLLTYKVFSCKDLWSKLLGVRLLAVYFNTQSSS